MAEDDYGESYYYRGEADNWVSFAGFYWRIIRINGDNSIKLIYSGTKTNSTGDGARIGYSKYNTNYKEEKYADYKISTIKNVVDNWYEINILDKGYDNKIADTGYCNDMSKKKTYEFGSWDRLYINKTPTLKCPDKNRDLLSKSNNKLTYPVALLTWDEGSFAGGLYYTGSQSFNQSYYLYIGKHYWTMTTTSWNGPNVNVGIVNEHGGLSHGYLGFSSGVRPVLSLKPNVLVTSGDGTEANPYIVS